jgi:hypothetical protein
MGLNPSCNNVQGKGLPVLGDPPFSAEAAETAKTELSMAIQDALFDVKEETRRVFKKGSKGDRMGRMGISAPYDGMNDDIEEVTLYRIEARALGWRFYRAWYYWSCSTDQRPIPEVAARAMNDEWGQQIRVDGFAGGTSVDGPVSSYHVDTLAGLLRLVKEIQAS